MNPDNLTPANLTPANLTPANLTPANLTPDSTTQELLAQMMDIQAPTPVSWWPLAPGWWILLGLLVLALLAFFVYHRSRAPRRAALYELELLAQQYRADGNVADFCQGWNRLLKRMAFVTWGRRIAAVHGRQWLALLNLSCRRPPFSPDLIEQLATANYRPQAKVDVEACVLASRRWIKRHRSGLMSRNFAQQGGEGAHA